MRKLISHFLFVVVTCSTLSASAVTFNYGDLLLIFRQDNLNDIEFNTGSISNYLGLPNGTVKTVTNWNYGVVTDTWSGNVSGGNFVLIACTTFLPGNTNSCSWMSDADTSSPLYVTASKLSQQISTITQIGNDATNNTIGSTTNYYIADPGTTASYTYHATGGGAYGASTLNGSSVVTVEQSMPGTARLFEIHSSSATPKPAAKLIGTFTLSASGVLTFTAGQVQAANPPPAPQIVSTAIISGTMTISFTTTNGATYRLHYSNSLGGSVSSWPTLGTPVSGDGTTMSFQDTPTTARFYAIEAY